MKVYILMDFDYGGGRRPLWGGSSIVSVHATVEGAEAALLLLVNNGAYGGHYDIIEHVVAP